MLSCFHKSKNYIKTGAIDLLIPATGVYMYNTKREREMVCISESLNKIQCHAILDVHITNYE